jgi:hypothetical protein
MREPPPEPQITGYFGSSILTVIFCQSQLAPCYGLRYSSQAQYTRAGSMDEPAGVVPNGVFS